jgi:hypothetical protein
MPTVLVASCRQFFAALEIIQLIRFLSFAQFEGKMPSSQPPRLRRYFSTTSPPIKTSEIYEQFSWQIVRFFGKYIKINPLEFVTFIIWSSI